MKKVVAFLLAILIFVAPVTTLVKADVVIGDNDDIIVNENATILGRKLALMESLSDLALSGVTEFTISNTNDVDSYIDSLWSEVNDAIDYLNSGEWAEDIQDNIASKYYTNLVQYKDYINNRGDYFAHLLPSGNPTSNLLSTFFANNIFGKHSTLHNNLSLDTFRSLSALRQGSNEPTPSPNPDYSFISNVNNLSLNGIDVNNNFLTVNWYNSYLETYLIFQNSISEYTLFSRTGEMIHQNNNTNYINYFDIFNNILALYLNNNGDGSYTLSFSPSYFTKITMYDLANISGNYNFYSLQYNQYNGLWYFSFDYNSLFPSIQTSFAGLSTAINYIYNHFCNINLYVDGQLWVYKSTNVNNQPTLDIDGYLKIYGNDNPQQYQLQPNTKIDYDQLYQIIYNAISDNLPISPGDINYYDSHDTIYSPTIINNYGEEEGEESDLIDTILDYAVIPKFDTAIAQPMRQALTNGVLIMNNSITNVIPDEILLILGACFFLLLFAVVINRMIK